MTREIWEMFGIVAVITFAVNVMYCHSHWKALLALQPPKNPPELAGLVTQLDRDLSAVLEDARAIQRYGASLMSARDASLSDRGEQAVEVNDACTGHQ